MKNQPDTTDRSQLPNQRTLATESADNNTRTPATERATMTKDIGNRGPTFAGRACEPEAGVEVPPAVGARLVILVLEAREVLLADQLLHLGLVQHELHRLPQHPREVEWALRTPASVFRVERKGLRFENRFRGQGSSVLGCWAQRQVVRDASASKRAVEAEMGASPATDAA